MKAHIRFDGPYRACEAISDDLMHKKSVSIQEKADYSYRYDVFYDDIYVAEQELRLSGWDGERIGDIPVSLDRW